MAKKKIRMVSNTGMKSNKKKKTISMKTCKGNNTQGCICNVGLELDVIICARVFKYPDVTYKKSLKALLKIKCLKIYMTTHIIGVTRIF